MSDRMNSVSIFIGLFSGLLGLQLERFVFTGSLSL